MRKIQKNDPRTSLRKGLPHVRPTSPVCALTGAGGLRIRSRGRTRPESPRRAPCAVGSGRSTVEDGGRGQKEEKHRLSPRLRQISAGFIVKQE